MKNDDYQNFLKKYDKRLRAMTKDNILYGDFKNKTTDQFNEYYYEWDKKYKFSDSMKANVNFSVSSSFLDKVETSLARIDLALDRLLDYLHDKKNS